MKNAIYKSIFNFNIENGIKLSVSNNEIYSQLILYIFFSVQSDLIILVPTLNDANKLFNNLKSYISNVYIFPEDDYLTKKAIAASTDLLFMRMSFLNSIDNCDKKILICHVNSFIKKLPAKSEYLSKSIKLNNGQIIDRNEFLKKLDSIGYKKESLVTNVGEYAVRGFVIDVYPFQEDHPVRIDFFDNEISNISFFDEYSQRTIKDNESILIKPLIDNFNDNASSVIEYLNSPYIVLQDYNQCQNIMKNIVDQIKYYDNDFSEIFFLNDMELNKKINVDLIDNTGKYDYIFAAKSIVNCKNDFDCFLNLVKNDSTYLCTTNANFIKKVKKSYDKVKIINFDLNSGFIYNDVTYLSDNDLVEKREKDTFYNYKFGKKINDIEKLNIGDYVVHKSHGIGIYMGISTITKNSVKKDYILIQYKGNDRLYLSIDNIDKLYKYSSREGVKPKINKLNSIEWQKTKIKIKNKIRDISNELIEIYKKRSQIKVPPFLRDDPLQLVFESEFPYEFTEDQEKSTEQIKKDLESGKPMERLLCGDVGYGKTEVIFRVIFKTVLNNKQAMYLCPTTLLSLQQYKSALERFKNFSVNTALLNRHTSIKEAKEIIEKLKTGKIDVIFGTHRLLSEDVKFKDLGLLVVDEEHRFGVMHKEKIKKIKENVHVLSVSATPIPRSLQMSLIGIRDLSLIETPPKNRYPVQTYVIAYDKYVVREIILKEYNRQGQVFILYNNIVNMDKVLYEFRKLVPEVKFASAHGKMNKVEINSIMSDFVEKKFDVLLSTTIIENGIDIPNANTVIVIDADKYGLSQLYQIRGRVGRGDRIAYAYLMYDKNKVLNENAQKRLEAIKEFTELGSGYKLAMRDLSIRGAGDLLGSEQAGFIDSVGVDMYLELVNEEINNKEEEKNDIILDDVETHIDKTYSDEEDVILSIHKEITSIENMRDLEKVHDEILDRFGYIDEKLEIYMYQELLEKLVNKYEIIISMNTNQKFSIRLNENIYNKLNIEDLFIQASRINTKFNFIYRGNSIFIELNKINLEKHYVFYVTKLLIYIDEQINKTSI